MSNLPVIVGFGGINSAGRSSGHHAYRRMVIDALDHQAASQTLANLAVLRGMIQNQEAHWVDDQGDSILPEIWLKKHRREILAGTLIRTLELNLHDFSHLRQHQRARISSAKDGEPFRFSLPLQNLPAELPGHWQVSPAPDGRTATVTVTGELEALLPDTHASTVNCAGQLPSGFMPDALYPSRNHPRGLQMTVYGASDAIRSIGIDWDVITRHVAPDQIAVYAGSSMSQLDYNGNGGMLQARLLGKKVTAKQLPLGFSEMPADFINAYLLGNLGSTGASLGACASFHYNLAQAVRDIQNGSHRVVIVGGSEAPIVPEVVEGYANMGALADDAKLLALDADKGANAPDHQRACRPFGHNAGFTLGESAQFFVLFDDALALELGANIHGAVNDVFVNADGFKKSIASPGIGNYITVAKAAAATAAVIGQERMKHHSFVQAHGTSTPQNRVTESLIFRDIAHHFGISRWPVSAIKSYVGHSLCCAGADQLVASLGVWKYGILPGILTTDILAEDVATDNLDFLLQHRQVGTQAMDAVLLNAKGFGGNNATASILSPHVARAMLSRKHGKKAMAEATLTNEKVAAASADYDRMTCQHEVAPIYNFDHQVRGGEHLHFDGSELHIDGYTSGVNLQLKSRYPDMQD